MEVADVPQFETRLANIHEVCLDTGIGKESLRAWERRYAFPKPARDAVGNRAYTQAEIAKLKLIKRLVDCGYRPSAIVSRTLTELRALLHQSAHEPSSLRDNARFRPLLDILLRNDPVQLNVELEALLRTQGLESFATQTVAPLLAVVGNLWAVGEIEIYQEHLFSQTVQTLLQEGIRALRSEKRAPRVLLATFPGEQHQLGLLLAQAMLSAESAYCLSLGASVPLDVIAQAAQAHRADVVAVSGAACFPVRSAEYALATLDASLAPQIEVWIGGSAARALRSPPPRVRIVRALTDIRPTVQSWRAMRKWGAGS